jgi:glycine cleavage system transcriptional repressor
MNSLIISAVGSDRPGIVSEISGVITSHGGNIEKSRMTRLGADFTIIMLVAVDPRWEESLVVALQAIKELSISTKGTEPNAVIAGENCKDTAGENCQISLSGADNEGIVKVLSKYLEEKSINIIEMDTHISQAPISGSPLFNLNAAVSIPGEIDGRDIQSDLSQIAQELGVEIHLNI